MTPSQAKRSVLRKVEEIRPILAARRPDLLARFERLVVSLGFAAPEVPDHIIELGNFFAEKLGWGKRDLTPDERVTLNQVRDIWVREPS